MKVRLFSLTSAMESLGVPMDNRAQVLSIALARSIAYKLPIPATAVDDAKCFFLDTHKQHVERVLCKINERIVVDVDNVTSVVGNLWLFRYRLAHDPNNGAVRDFMDSMLKVGAKEFPASVSEGMIAHGQDGLMDKVAHAVDESLVPEPEAEVEVSNEGLFSWFSKENRLVRAIASEAAGIEWIEKNVLAHYDGAVSKTKADIKKAGNPKERDRLERHLKALHAEHLSFSETVRKSKAKKKQLEAELAELRKQKKEG